MSERKLMNGSMAVALGAKLSNVEVVAAYPITPQTLIVEYLANFIANGELKALMINVESEHSALAAIIGASLAGARTFTATASQGLALMHEMVHWTAASRAPVVMAVCNRALAPPWNIGCDQQDSISQRDTGWMQVYCENAQEALDMMIQAYKIAENEEVLLPIMVTQDGFLVSHTYEPVLVPKQKMADDFLPPYTPKYVISDPENPYSQNTMDNGDWSMELKYSQEVAMNKARAIIGNVADEFSEKFGRYYGKFIDTYRMDGADVALVTFGANVGTAREAIDRAREKGKNVGLVKLRFFRPFPFNDIKDVLGGVDAVAVVEKDYSYGCGGAAYTEIKAALYETRKKPPVISFIGGFGGREITIENLEEVIDKTLRIAKTGIVEKPLKWINLKTREGG